MYYSLSGNQKGELNAISYNKEGCLFGGATAPWGDAAGKEIQMQSVIKFIKATKDNHCDVAVVNHTAFDAGVEKIAYSRARMTYLPNIYVLGEDGVQKFCEVFIREAE